MQSATLLEQDDNGRKATPDQLFRRAAFDWAVATKRMVEASQELHLTSKVANTALADIEYARKLLINLSIPSPRQPADSLPTVDSVIKTVDGWLETVSKIFDVPTSVLEDHRPEPFQISGWQQYIIENSPEITSIIERAKGAGTASLVVKPGYERWRVPVEPTQEQWEAYAEESKRIEARKKAHRVGDLSEPVYSKNGKALWADRECSKCHSKSNERCKSAAGNYLDKPHGIRRLGTEEVDTLLLQH